LVNPEIIQPNAHVILDYVLKDPSGVVLDESTSDGGEPIIYVHGYGMLVPGLEAGLAGMREGEEKEIVVRAEEGFGERDEDLVVEIDRAEFPEPDKVAIGEEFVAESPDGNEAVMRVVEVHSDYVLVDANHPLAGVTLHYAVKVREVREATESELEQAAAEFEEARRLAEEEEEEESAALAPLITLGKKAPGPPN
jgi:FKBP-type peptidyl-prolyl cis-trans isomerase SlyD